ncbi:hypothetical protein PoB_007087000 [Plakobranchus ocellatus]|uniref:VWFA domain-containing protein n=1 Tax=Plakobranchus ocellatus TaxID=259542 RepID=A0AAV4DJP0_9GAST|nr:hypothetical protein PoB_007087000 [Plakobranchus ocellatus]
MVPFAVLLVTACLFSSLEASVVKREKNDCPAKCKSEPLDISFIVDSKDSFGFTANTDKNSLEGAINMMPYRSGVTTETGMAIKWYLDNHLPQVRPNVRHVVIVLTDGNSQQPEITKEEAMKAHAQGLDVFAIGVGHEVSKQELHNIASDASENAEKKDTWLFQSKAISLISSNLSPKACQFDPVDISFVIDSSVSIGEQNFTLGLAFIRHFLDSFEINPSSIRVAAIMFGEGVYSNQAMPFDMYQNKEDTLDAILSLRWMHATRTDTGRGIDFMVDQFLPNARPYAAHIGIVITDGKSQEEYRTMESAERARNAGVTMYAVGVGSFDSNLDAEELTNIAGDSARVLTADNYAMLNSIKASLTDITCVGIERSLQSQREVFQAQG